MVAPCHDRTVGVNRAIWMTESLLMRWSARNCIALAVIALILDSHSWHAACIAAVALPLHKPARLSDCKAAVILVLAVSHDLTVRPKRLHFVLDVRWRARLG